MAERLFQGQIRPAAQPLGAFLQPSQNSIAGATQLASMPRGSQIATLQQAGTSGVAGFNQMEQLSKALEPFSAQLQKSVDRGMRQYAINNIESGYYDTLKNEEVKARLVAQQNKEVSTAAAADTISKIEAVDPIAGQLAREANPWRAVGRNRALAQLAASQVGPLLAGELQKPEYAGLKPGSPQLAQAKATVTQGLLNRFGLTGDELESTYYVTPAVNKGWDKFSQEQAKIYNQELAYSQTVLASASVGTFFDEINQNGGIRLPDGTLLDPTNKAFPAVAGGLLTQKIDASLALLPGKAREEAWEQIQKTLGFWAGSGTGALAVVQQVGVGPSRYPDGTKIPYIDKEGNPVRPRFFQTYPIELVDNTNTGLKARNELNQQQQSAIETKLRNAYYDPETGPAGAPFGSKEWQARVARHRDLGRQLGAQDGDAKTNDMIKEQQDLSQSISAPTVEEQRGVIAVLNALRPEDIDTPAKVQQYVDLINNFAQNTSGGSAEVYEKNRKSLMDILDQKQKNFGTVAQNIGLQGSLTRFVNEDLADSGITDLLSTEQGRAPGQSWADFLRNSTNLTSNQKQIYLNFGNEVRSMYQREYDRLATEWWGENPNASVMPQGVGAGLLDKAKVNVRKSIRYDQLKGKAASAGNPDPGKTTKSSTEPGSSQSTQPAAEPVKFDQRSAPSASAEQARAYTQRPILTYDYLKAQLTSVRDKGYATPSMNELADKAGTSSLVLLRKQLDFATSSNPQEQSVLNAWKTYLDGLINRQSSSELPGQANYEYAMAPSAATYNPRAPGAWLMAELFPTAV